MGLDGTEYINLNSKNSNSFAYCIKSDMVLQEYNKVIEKIKNTYELNSKININGYVIGATNKGKGINNVDLNVIDGKKLPLILV